jgi:hypothetical protein
MRSIIVQSRQHQMEWKPQTDGKKTKAKAIHREQRQPGRTPLIFPVLILSILFFE